MFVLTIKPQGIQQGWEQAGHWLLSHLPRLKNADQIVHPKLQAVNRCQVKSLGKDMPNSFSHYTTIWRIQNNIW